MQSDYQKLGKTKQKILLNLNAKAENIRENCIALSRKFPN